LGLFFVLSAPSEKPDLTARQLGTAILLSLLVSYAPGELIWTNQLTTKFSTLQTEKMKLEELQDFYKKYAPAEVGLGDGDHYSDTFYRVLLVFEGAHLFRELDGSRIRRSFRNQDHRVLGTLRRAGMDSSKG
jgi:hypothetical protein